MATFCCGRRRKGGRSTAIKWYKFAEKLHHRKYLKQVFAYMGHMLDGLKEKNEMRLGLPVAKKKAAKGKAKGKGVNVVTTVQTNVVTT